MNNNNTLPTNRVEAIDIARGIGGLFIPAAHVLLIYADSHTQEEHWLGIIGHFFGKWAGVFLIAMGFSFTLSKRNNIEASIKRGISILLIGYGMNFLKFIIPAFLNLFPENFIQAYGWSLPLSMNNYMFMLSTGDILQLTGLCLLGLGIVHKCVKQQKELLILVLVIILAITEYLRGYHLGVVGVDYIFDLLWGQDWNVYFPAFPWGGFIILGMYFGYVFHDSGKNVNHTFNKILLVGILLTLIGGWLCYSDYDKHMRDYFHLGIGGFFYLAGFNLLFFWLAQKVYKYIETSKLMNVLKYCSVHITSMYVIQWVLICWGMTFIGYKAHTTKGIIFLAILFTFLTFGVQKIVDYVYKKLVLKN